jgi:hypothetical protein
LKIILFFAILDMKGGCKMKRTLCVIICAVLVFSLMGCSLGGNRLPSGFYYAEGEYEEYLTPYLLLDTEDQTFSFGGGTVLSYAERGSYMVVGEKLVAKTQNATYTFEIKDDNTIVLSHDCEAPAKLKAGTQFVYNKQLS